MWHKETYRISRDWCPVIIYGNSNGILNICQLDLRWSLCIDGLEYRGRENFNASWRMLSDITTTRTNSTYFESHRFKLRYMMYIIDSWRWHYTWARLLSMTEQGRTQWEKTLHIYVTSSLIGWDVTPPWKETGPVAAIDLSVQSYTVLTRLYHT